MKINKTEKTTLASSKKTLPTSAQHSDADSSLIDLDDVVVRYGEQTVINDVSLCVHAGEFVGLIGPNGAGKTTLLKVMLGLLRPTSGTVRAQRGIIGYVPQRGSMHDAAVPINVHEVAMLGSRGDRSAALRSLDATGVRDLADKRFSSLSGGQQQRVLIAKALASNPALLVLDEPTTGIDERSQVEFYDILRDLQQKGLAIIMVSHDVDTVLSLVTRVMCLNQSIVYDGAPEHFEADKFLPRLYNAQHRVLHHHHGDGHA